MGRRQISFQRADRQVAKGVSAESGPEMKKQISQRPAGAALTAGRLGGRLQLHRSAGHRMTAPAIPFGRRLGKKTVRSYREHTLGT